MTRRGRRDRERNAAVVDTIVHPSVALPSFDIATAEQVDLIHDMSMRILEEAGIAFYDDESVAILREHGVAVDGDSIARFDRELVATYVGMAPSSFEHTARNPERSVTVGGDHMVFAPVAGPPFVSDLEGGRRSATYDDLVNFIKITMSTPYLHNQGTEIVVPNDIPFHERGLDIVYAHIKYGDKPMMGHYPIGLTAHDSVEMAKIVFGPDVVASKHVLLAVINISSPRRLDDRMLGTLKTYATNNQALVMTPFILAGAMGPAALLGTVAQANAEALAAVAFAQMVNPGTPCIYGPFLAVVDLQSGAPVFGAAESLLAQTLCSQLSARYELPFRAAGGYSSSKVPDMQAGYEAVMSMLPSLLNRPHFVLHAAGWLEAGLTTSYEKFMLDIELCGVMHRLVRGVSWDDDEWAMESILEEVPPGGHHLGTTHTLGRFRDAFHRAELFDYDSYEQWSAAGSLDSAQRAAAKWRQVVDAYEQPRLDDAVDAELLDYMARRRRQIDPAEFQ